MIICYLTCADQAEADTIRNVLLTDKLIACGRTMAIDSAYWYAGLREHDAEILLIMETLAEKFDAIEQKIQEIHSYDLFVLTAVQAAKTSNSVDKWLHDSLN